MVAVGRMEHIPWSPSERHGAREVCERAAEAESQELLAAFRGRAAATRALQKLWLLRRELETSGREFPVKFDYRYSQLLLVFGSLVCDGRVYEGELNALSQEKPAIIRRIASLQAGSVLGCEPNHRAQRAVVGSGCRDVHDCHGGAGIVSPLGPRMVGPTSPQFRGRDGDSDRDHRLAAVICLGLTSLLGPSTELGMAAGCGWTRLTHQS
jgi:hypothetical protein